MQDRAIPVLPSRDFDATVQFYAGLGFRDASADLAWNDGYRIL